LSDIEFWECPNCGGTDFTEIAPNKHRCVYCGTVLTSRKAPETKPEPVRCPRCGFENERGDRYCNNCGRALLSWLPAKLREADPAVISIIATVVGSFMLPIPFAGAALGLYLAYKALRDARDSGGTSSSEKLAKFAIVIGWCGIAYGMLPLCLLVGGPTAQGICSACNSLFETLSDKVRRIVGGIGGR
jgi:hypothetical protein